MPTVAMVIRDRLMAKVQAMSFFTGHGFTFTTNKSVAIQPQSIPFCGVYLIEEVGTPDGDANVAENRFRTTARYGFSVIVQNNDMEVAEQRLDDAMVALNGLFSDPTVYNWEGYQKNGEAAIQAFSRGSRTHAFGAVGMDNEIPIAELRFDMSCDLGVIMHPTIEIYDFERLHIETRYPKPNEQNVQQIIAQWDILNAETIGTVLAVRCYLFCNAIVV
jgi:hypothetical protein